MKNVWMEVLKTTSPELKNEVGVLTPKLEQVIHTLEWVRIDEFVVSSWCGNGRPPHDRAALASAFVAKCLFLSMVVKAASMLKLKSSSKGGVCGALTFNNGGTIFDKQSVRNRSTSLE